MGSLDRNSLIFCRNSQLGMLVSYSYNNQSKHTIIKTKPASQGSIQDFFAGEGKWDAQQCTCFSFTISVTITNYVFLVQNGGEGPFHPLVDGKGSGIYMG